MLRIKITPKKIKEFVKECYLAFLKLVLQQETMESEKFFKKYHINELRIAILDNGTLVNYDECQLEENYKINPIKRDGVKLIGFGKIHFCGRTIIKSELRYAFFSYQK